MMASNPVPMKNIHEPFDAKSRRRPDNPEYISPAPANLREE